LGLPTLRKGAMKMAVKVDESKCTGCGICAEACSVGAITIDQVARIDAAICTDCRSCIAECPNDAISMERIEARSSSKNSPTLPSAPRPPGVPPGFQQVRKGGFLGKISDFLGRFSNQGRGQGYGRGKGRGGGRGRGKGRWR